MLLRMQSCMIIAFKKVFRCGYHDKPSLLVTQWGSSPGVKLTVWVWVPQIIEYLCLHHSKIPRYMHVFHCIDIIFNLIHLQETAMRWTHDRHNIEGEQKIHRPGFRPSGN